MSNSSELRSLGLVLAGAYRGGQFEIDPAWKSHQVVYVWTRGPDAAEILRVGIACGPHGFSNRYGSYNRWLDGRFKPDEATEQEKSRLFRLKLDDTCAVWARRVADKPTALREEADLRARFGPALELDLMAPGWAKSQLAAWRAGRAGQGVKPAAPRQQGPAPTASGSALTVAPSLKAVFAVLDHALTHLGLERSQVRDGWPYRKDGVQLCRIDPKNSKGCLRVWVGEQDEQTAPDSLRGQFRQKGWLVVWPEDRALAVEYILASVRRRTPA